MKFSIIVPAYNRNLLKTPTLNSLLTQRFQDWAAIFIDDGSTVKEAKQSFDWIEANIARARVIRLEHGERAIAFNAGFDAARGEWLAMCDSDDAWDPYYLSVLDQAIKDYPGAMCFNFGAIVHRKDGTELRRTFKPRWLGDRHEEFKSGKIGSGSFIFHRDVWASIEHFPEARTARQLHEMATDIHHLYPLSGPTLGNPFGQDFLLFYRCTRKFQSIPLDNCLYVQYVRGHFEAGQ